MMIKQSGMIEYVKGDGKSFKMDDGNWYSVFRADSLKATKGDYVEFNYVVNGSFNNVKGTVVAKTAPASTPVTAKPTMGSTGFTNPRGFVEKQFPVPPLHPDRSIIRQNSLGHAVKVLETTGIDGGLVACEPEEYANKAVEIARIFESYSTGDQDFKEAEEEVAKMLAKEYN